MNRITFLFLICMLTSSWVHAQKNTIPFTVATNYFVVNNYPEKELHMLKIVDEQQFDHIFGKAPLASKNGQPTSIDFSKSFVIALIDAVSNTTEELSVKSLTKEGTKLQLQYEIKQRKEASSASFRFYALIVVDNTYEGTISGRKFNPKGEPIVGDDLDETGCKPATGMTWSVLQNDCIQVWESKYVLEGGDNHFALVFNPEQSKAEVIGLQLLDAKYKGNLIFEQIEKGSWKNKELILTEMENNQFVLKAKNKEIARGVLRK